MELDQVRLQDQGDFGQKRIVRIHGHSHDPGPTARTLEQGRGMQRIDVSRAPGEHYRPDKGRTEFEGRIKRVRRGKAADLGAGHEQTSIRAAFRARV
jgi:hypothetical protein